MTTPPARGGHATPPAKPTPTPPRTGTTAATIRPSQKVTIASITPPILSVTALMDATRPQPTNGYGGWEILGRVRRRAILEWDGGQPWKIDVNLILWNPGGSVEDDCDRLEEMAISPSPLQPPPTVIASGPFSKATGAAKFVIADLAWGDAHVLASGDRWQQFVTVSLLQKADEAFVQTATKAAKSAAKNTSSYVVKSGDTLDSIAKDQLGDVKRKTEIVALNLGTLGKDPRNLKPGVKILLPPKTA